MWVGASAAIAGLHSLRKGANKTPPLRFPAFTGIAANGPPRRSRDSKVQSSSRGWMH